MAGKRQLSAWDITVLHEKAEMEEAEAATTTRETYVATCKTCRLQFAYTGQEPDECARCCPDTASTWQPSQGVDRIVPIPYKPPSPELMKLLEQAQQLASDAVMYGSAFWTVGLDGSKRRVDPAAVRAVVDGIAVEAEPRYLHLPKVRHEGENLPPHIQAMISDYAKAWENDIMTVGNADQVGGLKSDHLAAMDQADEMASLRALDTDTGNATMGLTDWYGLCGHVWKRTQGSQCPECCGTGNMHLGLATSFGKATVTPEMKWVGFQAGLELQPRAPLQGETVEAIYRAMHAAAPEPLSPDAKGLVGALEEAAERWYDVADLIESPEGYRNGGFPRESAWRCLNAIELYKNLPVPLVSEAADADWAVNFVRSKAFQAQKDRIAALEIERSGMQEIIDLLSARCQGWADEVTRLRAGMTSTENAGAHDYHGPTETVPHPDMPDRTVQRAVPDPAHEQFHRAVGDVLAGKIIPAARRQMEDALGRAPKEPTAAPDAILRGNKAPVGIVERKT